MSLEEVGLIGTRRIEDVSLEALDLYKKSAIWCAERFIIKTGAAKGADQIAVEEALKKDASIHLYLPFKDYETDWINKHKSMCPSCFSIHIYNDSLKEWKESVAKYHPNPKALSRGGFALHARNYPIIKNDKFVIALTNPNKGGGTEQGIRIATDLNIPVYNLKIERDRNELRKLMGI